MSMKPDWIKAIEAAADKFWKEEYPKKSFDERCNYWMETMEKGMREQEKLGLPKFSVFNKSWYESVKEQESDIEKILDQIFNTHWIDLDKHSFEKAVSNDAD